MIKNMLAMTGRGEEKKTWIFPELFFKIQNNNFFGFSISKIESQTLQLHPTF
jgi:hypothetical protein